MYHRYYNEYERRAEEIRQAAQLPVQPKEPPRVESALPVLKPEPPPAAPKKKPAIFGELFGNIFDKFGIDDIILGLLILMLIQEEDSDILLLIILGYLFISGF